MSHPPKIQIVSNLTTGKWLAVTFSEHVQPPANHLEMSKSISCESLGEI